MYEQVYNVLSNRKLDLLPVLFDIFSIFVLLDRFGCSISQHTTTIVLKRPPHLRRQNMIFGIECVRINVVCAFLNAIKC